MNVEEYFAALPEPSRVALERLRRTIRRAAPDAEETISYQMPAFAQDGRTLVSYAAFKNHCSLFPTSTAVIAEHEEELRPFLAGKGTLRFDIEHPIPDELVAQLVEARIAENAARKRR
jgi:uncharacterized protein YdhG (YjbR/CyaY superfamily)